MASSVATDSNTCHRPDFILRCRPCLLCQAGLDKRAKKSWRRKDPDERYPPAWVADDRIASRASHGRQPGIHRWRGPTIAPRSTATKTAPPSHPRGAGRRRSRATACGRSGVARCFMTGAAGGCRPARIRGDLRRACMKFSVPEVPSSAGNPSSNPKKGAAGCWRSIWMPAAKLPRARRAFLCPWVRKQVGRDIAVNWSRIGVAWARDDRRSYVLALEEGVQDRAHA